MKFYKPSLEITGAEEDGVQKSPQTDETEKGGGSHGKTEATHRADPGEGAEELDKKRNRATDGRRGSAVR